MATVRYLDRDEEEREILVEAGRVYIFGSSSQADCTLPLKPGIHCEHVAFFHEDGEYFVQSLTSKKTRANYASRDSYKPIPENHCVPIRESLTVVLGEHEATLYFSNLEYQIRDMLAESGDFDLTFVKKDNHTRQVSKNWAWEELKRFHFDFSCTDKRKWNSFILKYIMSMFPDVCMCALYLLKNNKKLKKDCVIRKRAKKEHDASRHCIRRVIKTGEPHLFNVIEDEEKEDYLTLNDSEILSCMIFPIFEKSDIIAMLYFESDSVINQEDFRKLLDFLEVGGVSNLISALIERSR